MSLSVQTKSGSQSTSGNLAVTFSSNVAAGNTIIAIAMDDTSGGLSISDSQGNSYTSLYGPNTGTHETSRAWKATAGSSGSLTVTVNAVNPFPVLIIIEYPASLGIGAVDQSSTNSASSGTALTSGTAVTTTQANELLIAYGGSESNGGTFTLGGSFAMESQVTAGVGGTCLFVADRAVISTGSYQATATMSPSQSWFCSLITLKISGSVGGGSAQPVVCIMQ